MDQTIRRMMHIDLPQGQSAFPWGPRKTGKTTYLKTALPDSLMYDLLQTDLFLELAKRPFLLREQLLAADPRRKMDDL
jgi:predicted AAA+ superfamily ATPase